MGQRVSRLEWVRILCEHGIVFGCLHLKVIHLPFQLDMLSWLMNEPHHSLNPVMIKIVPQSAQKIDFMQYWFDVGYFHHCVNGLSA